MSDDRHNPATTILLGETARAGARSWLVLGGEAALARGIAGGHPDAEVLWQPVDVRERDAIDAMPQNLRIEDPGAETGIVEAAVVAAPPDRALARRWLLAAQAALAGEGRLFLAGANAEGIRSIVADARALFGTPRREGYRARQRVAVFAAGAWPAAPPPWASAPGVAPGTWREFPLELRDRHIPLVTQAGVFAGARIDAGTRLLIDALPDRIEGRFHSPGGGGVRGGVVLDVGCGAGMIGIAMQALGASRVDLTDVNLLAVQAAAENLRRLGLTGCRALAGDVYGAVAAGRYDLIVSNPPFHRGKAVDLTVADRLIAEAPDHLTASGSLLLVANAFLAYGTRMARVFQEVETIAATRQYHVLQATEPR